MGRELRGLMAAASPRGGRGPRNGEASPSSAESAAGSASEAAPSDSEAASGEREREGGLGLLGLRDGGDAATPAFRSAGRWSASES
jgi:hypothetical protein